VDSQTPKQLAFLAGLKTLAAMPSRDGAPADIKQLERDWWRVVQDAGWITPQVWAGAVVELQGEGSWRPAWPEVYDACRYAKLLLEEEGVTNYAQAQQQRAERARTGVENRPGRAEPALPMPDDPPTAREVRRALVLRHIAIGKARQRNRNRLMADYAKRHGLSLGRTEIPEEAWKGQDEPTPEEIAAVLRETRPEPLVEALYRALRPGERQPYKVGWSRIAPDGSDEPGSNPHYTDIVKPDPPSPNQQKEREKVMNNVPNFPPYNDTQFKRDHPGVNPYAEPDEYTWPKVE
jgi:hypothetical protein